MLPSQVVFESKVAEIERYYKFLQLIIADEGKIYRPRKKTWRYFSPDEDLHKIFKENCFLLLYNLVESSVRGVVTDLYDAVGAENLTYEKLALELRQIWVSQNYRNLGHAAHPNKYRDLAKLLIEDALGGTVINLKADRLPRAGNLDARKIREIGNDLGIRIAAHGRARGGGKLQTVREMRNKLAHGIQSFSECGRDFTLDDLEEIKNEVFVYLKSVMRNMEAHISNKKYCA